MRVTAGKRHCGVQVRKIFDEMFYGESILIQREEIRKVLYKDKFKSKKVYQKARNQFKLIKQNKMISTNKFKIQFANSLLFITF